MPPLPAVTCLPLMDGVSMCVCVHVCDTVEETRDLFCLRTCMCLCVCGCSALCANICVQACVCGTVIMNWLAQYMQLVVLEEIQTAF